MIVILCITAGLLCLAYFILLMVYSGFTSTFYLIWPIMSGGFWLLGWLFHIHFFRMLPSGVRAGLWILCCTGLLFFLSVEGMILKAALQTPKPDQDYVVVLGAHVRSTGPSRALALRLNKALEYANENPHTIFIVSGGQGFNEPCTEASVMSDYLIGHGLSKDRILLEEKATNTRENLAFSKDMIPEGSSVGIISNGFHICRALHLAKTLGYQDPAGIPAKGDALTEPSNLLREFFAVVKDFWIIR